MSTQGIDVHDTHPTDCAMCADFTPCIACLEHTCPDCGAIVWGLKNNDGELIHECPYETPKLDALMARPQPEGWRSRETEDVASAVIVLWNNYDGWIPGGAYRELAVALGVDESVLLDSRRTRKPPVEAPGSY